MQPPGELIYVSERKLRDLARHFKIDTRSYDTAMTVRGSATGTLPFGPGTKIEGSVEASAQRVDDDKPRRELLDLLGGVTAKLESAVAPPNIDAAASEHSGTPVQNAWFRFRRPLRFGVGAANDDHAVRALVLVDEEGVDDEGVVPGLLLTGAPHHLQEPYNLDAPEGASARSGSGTGELFRWLQQARSTLEEDTRAGLGGPAAGLFGDSPVASRAQTAVSMYRLFAQDDWFPDIVRPALCEGMAIASLVVTHLDTTVIMGTPLYVRVASAERDQPGEASARSVVRRLFGAAGT